MNQITEQLLTGKDIAEHLEDLASLRLDIFREYPYLYLGQRVDELTYLAGYTEKPGSVTILAKDGSKVIGAATGAPLAYEQPALRDPFAITPYPPEEAYYVGELLFHQSYRSRGLGKRLLSQIESHICSLGNFRTVVCVTVERSPDHPLRPHGHIPINHFLDRTGFVRLDEVVANFKWLEVDGVERDHSMQFWLKELSKASLTS